MHIIGPLRYAKVMYVYAAQEEDELNLRVGDVVAVLNSDEEDGWYRGVLNGRCGLFPANVCTFETIWRLMLEYSSFQ